MTLFYTVYRTTKTDDGRFYIGVHKTRDPYDGYLGSGVHIKAAIKKYGRAAFIKEVLHVFSCAKDAYTKEKELVSEQLLINPLTFNMTTGGSGGDVDWSRRNRKVLQGSQHPQWGKKRTEAQRQRTSESLRRTWATNDAALRAGIQKAAATRRGTPSPLKGLSQTAESNAKRSLSHSSLPKRICKCGRAISPSNFLRHLASCSG